jgi:hypothetical protein
MGKKKALGMDPLTWLKSKNKEEKNNGVSNQRKPAKRVRSGSVVNLSSSKQKAREARTYESSDMKGKFRDIIFGGKKYARNSKPSAKIKSLGGMIFNGVSSEEELVEKPFEPKVVNLSNTAQKTPEVETYEPSDVTEKCRDDILGRKKSARKSRFSTTSKENPATIFVVVYTVLLLVLGFLVYKDMAGKINKLETKLTSIERQIGSDPMGYGDMNFD